MTNCKFCKKPTSAGQHYNGTDHNACWMVWSNRLVTNKCEYCGKNPQTSVNYYCDECGRDGKYCNYPGP